MQRIKTITDLSMLMEEDMRLFPGMARPSLSRLKTHDQYGMQSTRIEMSVHGGTHVDARRHFLEGGKTIDETPLELLMGEAIIFDLRWKLPGEVITSRDLERCAQGLQTKDIVILNTGYEGYGDPGRYCILDMEAAQWLVERGIKCLAVDMPSVDPVPEKNARASKQTHPAHHVILGTGIPIVENLANLDSLKNKRIFFMCLPLKLGDSEGAPARAIAIEFE